MISYLFQHVNHSEPPFFFRKSVQPHYTEEPRGEQWGTQAKISGEIHPVFSEACFCGLKCSQVRTALIEATVAL